MDDFETALQKCRNSVERFVKFRLPADADTDDVIQEIFIAANQNYQFLKDSSCFKPWILGIARNKCNDYYRRAARSMEIPLDEVSEIQLGCSRIGIIETNTVRDTLNELADKDKQILFLYFFQQYSQKEISHKLQIPIGTVKSRLHTAKQNFKEQYPYSPQLRGDIKMNRLPKLMPEYTITKSEKEPFAVIWEELMGWFIVPRLGEKLSWAMYDMPARTCTEYDEMEVIGKAEVHGIEGVEIIAKTMNPNGDTNTEAGEERHFVAGLTDTHCRYLAESHIKDGVNHFYTFLDGDSFLNNWGFGENNCGNETHCCAKGDIIRHDHTITSVAKDFLLDIVGRYQVSINGKTYDTVCIMDIDTYNSGVVSEQYLDKNGKTILWRRFNRNDWAYDHFQKNWDEMLPDNEQLLVNGEVYVHWYDCITDYIM